ncbi:putative myo inositol dehydrogenase [Aspergillus nomiae NRRL 13137]|uniref:Putative myo inositol dehydrogenase n=1 Tax=Aspergillus nomiae NRRL (strain ATCC 15546 / NRRL 13137 / CBS 260.88 / M93) TaxID=1509407 RepID=A0A0L1IX35_ASPN3|nr:putative myo inositol dehydrogenase [Aspergillus nomiae NRRL 13137]KNG83748.1 putative myo inositol dehydrogenase [Aspergillus nomiae NRRL 13137]
MKPTEATPGSRVIKLKVAGSSKPKTTRSIEELCNAPEVELVLIVNNHALHAFAAVLALQANKYVFIEKPIALTWQDTDRIIAADKATGGAKVFIGCMRRYAAALIDAVNEVASIGQIRYARVRDIIGPNSVFVGQFGTYPRTFNDYPEADSEALHTKTHNDMEQALHTELGITVTKETAMIAISNTLTSRSHTSPVSIRS